MEKTAKIKALQAKTPFIVPGIGKLDHEFGPFNYDQKNFPFRDAIRSAYERGIFALVDVDPSDVRMLEMAMPLRPTPKTTEELVKNPERPAQEPAPVPPMPVWPGAKAGVLEVK